MKCIEAEEYLSGYMESVLPSTEMERVRRHLEQCPRCAALLDAMRFAVEICRNYPEPEMDPRLPDRILARTTGRPASFYERLRRFVLQPLLAPRFAFGVGLAVLFFALTVHLIFPRMPAALSSLTPSSVYAFMDRGVRQLYGEGLKAYDKKNEWQAEFSYFKKRLMHKMQYMMEKFDITAGRLEAPVETDGERGTGPRRRPA
jgi:hypothetical protein